MGKELAEGKLHSLERQTALSRSYAEDIRARYVELEDHLHALDMENESLHQQVSHCTSVLPTKAPKLLISFQNVEMYRSFCGQSLKELVDSMHRNRPRPLLLAGIDMSNRAFSSFI